MKIQVGAGADRLPGFLNLDIRPGHAVDHVGHAGSLPTIGDGTADVLFAHAVFEHIFLAHHLPTLAEWRRVLANTGRAVCLALPDFETIAKLYLNNSPGNIGTRFDLHESYRLTHGEPEHACGPVWTTWKPEVKPNAAPAGYVPQLHKALFDFSYLRELLAECRLPAVIFRYTHPPDIHPVHLGFIASKSGIHAEMDAERIRAELQIIPEIERFVDLESVSTDLNFRGSDGFLEMGRALGSQTPAPLTLGRVMRGLKRRVSKVLSRGK